MKVRGLDRESVDKLIYDYDAALTQAVHDTLVTATKFALVATGPPAEQESSTSMFAAMDAVATIQQAWSEHVSGDLGPELAQVFLTAAKVIHGQVTKKVTADVASAMSADNASAFMKNAIPRLNGFSTELWEVTQRQVTLGLQDGESMKEIAQRIEDVAEIKAAKAQVIAQTLVIGAVNGGEYEQMKSLTAALGVQATKQWEATEDSHTRPTHATADGQNVQLNSHFQVGEGNLLFPGDPTGPPSEIISCRCSVLYDIDVEDDLQASSGPNHWAHWTGQFPNQFYWSREDTETSPGTPTNQPAVATNGALTAAFKEAEHPRGKDGKFIKLGVGLPGMLVNALKLIRSGKKDISELTDGEKHHAISDLPDITLSQWDNLKDEDKAHLTKFAEDALDEGIPGSAAALTHLEDLDQGGAQDATPDVFDPDTELPPVPSEKKVVEQQIYDAYDAGKFDADMQENLLQILHKKGPADAKKALTNVTAPDVTPSAPAAHTAPTTTIAKATPIKITHGLIHAKHTPGEIIAQTKVPSGEVRVKWNGKEYEVQLRKSSSASWDNIPSTKVKKSGLYAYLATNVANANWTKPGKVDVEVNAPSINTPSAPDVNPPTLNAPATKLAFPSHAETADATDAWNNTSEFGTPLFHESGKYKIEVGKGGNVFLHKRKDSGEWGPGKQVDEGEIPLGTWGDDEPITVPVSLPSVPTKAAAVPKPLGVNAPGPSAPKVAQKLDMTGWKQVGQQAGSNKGGLFEAPDGTRYYVKSLATETHANNEILAAALYKAAGVDIPEVRHVDNGAPPGWKNVIASKIVPNAKQQHNKFDGPANVKFKQDTQDGFMVDVWLANHDVVGATEDNIVIVDGKPVRIDAGGSLLYRAMGTPKGSEWNDDPFKNSNASYFGMKSKTKNFKAFKVFDDMTPEQEKESAKHLLGITDEQIDQMVADAGMPSSLAKTLKSRRNKILERYGLDAQNNSTPADIPDVTPAVNAPTPSVGAPTPANAPAPTHVGLSLIELQNHLLFDTNDDSYAVGDVIATGVSAKHPNAEYRVIMDTDGGPTYQYKTPNFDWKNNTTPSTFEKVDVKWTVNPPKPLTEKEQDNAALLNLWNKGLITSDEYTQQTGLPAPNSPNASTPTTNSHVPEDVISNWPGVVPATHTTGKLVASSIDGKYTLVEGNTPTWFYMKDATGDHVASFTAYDVKMGNVQAETNVDWIIPSSPASGAAPTLNNPAPPAGIDHIAFHKKTTFYNHFKDEKVSPAWSGAKIYNSLQVAKMKMAGDHEIAALTDEQMLDLVDEQLTQIAPLKYGTGHASYKKKVIDWLKTPNGKKAALAAKSGGWASGHASVSGMPSTLPPVYSAAAKKIAKKVAAAAATKKLTATDVFGPNLTPDVSNITESEQATTFSAFKGSTTGQYFKHKPEEIYWNAVQVGKTKGYTPGQVLALVDAQTTKNNGFAINGHNYENKVKDWLNTPAGQKKAYEIQQGTWSPSAAKTAAKKATPAYGGTTYGSSYGGAMAHPANKPFSQKVQLKGDQIEAFDSSKKPSDFSIISTAQGKTLWADMETNDGGPITASQKASLKYYTSNAGYTAMNRYLRGKAGATDATQAHIDKAQDGMRRLTQDVTLHRGAGFFTAWGSYAEIKANEGKVWHEPAFFSASVSGKSAFGGQIGYIIEAPAGTPGAFVKAFSNYGSENELFLAAGLKYQIISVENKGTPTTSGSQVTVRLRVVPDDTPAFNVVAAGTSVGSV